MTSVIEKIRNKDYEIVVIGLGYVGLPLALKFAKEGFRVVGVDSDSEKILMLDNGKSYLLHVDIPDNIDDLAILFDWSAPHDADAYIVCVPTPLNGGRNPDLSFVKDAMSTISTCIRDHGSLVVLESTTYPGTTSQIAEEILDKGSSDYYLAYSPEREDPGTSGMSIGNTSKIVGGIDAESTKIASELYLQICPDVIQVSSTEVAEAAKLLENIFRCVNIALVNELKMVFDKMGIDIWNVIEAASTKPRGFMPFYPGPGLGGHCIPIDPFYLTWKARHYGVSTKFIELAGEVNGQMPNYVVDKVVKSLNSKGYPVNGSTILVVGVAYKKNVGDTRESPAFPIIEMLINLGAHIEYYDPFVPVIPKTRKYSYRLVDTPLFDLQLSLESGVFPFRLTLILTDHDCINWDKIFEVSEIVVDTRGALLHLSGHDDYEFKVVKS